jgi:urease accessory protein
VSWHAHLSLRYRSESGRTVVHDRHEGPLRVLASLYPEGGAVCHNVIVHPPSGVVGGDRLDIDVDAAAGAHALITTPGATRFYRSAGEDAVQSVRLRISAGARVEWLPLESIAHPGCRAESRIRLELEPGAESIGWDIVALGLPASGQAFDHGSYATQIDLPGAWLERGRLDAADMRLLDSPLGLAGRRVLATAWFAAGSEIDAARRDALVEAARESIQDSPLAPQAGATALHPRLIVVRALADGVEPAAALLRRLWVRWRESGWRLAPCAPRVWGL